MARLKLYLHDFWRYRYLLQNLVMRDFKLKYRRSVLGVLWSVLNPLMMCLVLYAVFSTIFAAIRGTGIENFAVYLIIGQLLYSFFQESTSAAMGSMLGASQLIKKVYIPKYIFPLEKVCFSLVNCLFSFVALIIVMLITGAPLHVTVIMAWYPLLTMFVFNLGVGLVLAAMAVFFRDVMHLWTVFCTALMYFSAIFYDPAQFGDVFLLRFIQFNPIYWYISSFRNLVWKGEWLTWNMIWVCAACAILALVAGLFVFRRQQDKFVLYI